MKLSLPLAFLLLTGCGTSSVCTAMQASLATGLRLERQCFASSVVTFVRIDPQRYTLRLLGDGTATHPMPEWVSEHHLTGGINATLFDPANHSVGFLQVDGAPLQPNVARNYGGFVAFDPNTTDLPPVQILHRDAAGFNLEALRAQYRVIVQEQRLLDEHGQAMAWAESTTHSAAAVGMDSDGNVVLIHVRDKVTMTDFNTWLAQAAHRLTGALYVEGGSEASLYVSLAGHDTVAEVGNYTRTDVPFDNHEFSALPYIIGFAPVP